MEDDKAFPILAQWPHNSYKTKSGANDASYSPVHTELWFSVEGGSSVPENITFQLRDDAVKENWRHPGTQRFTGHGLPTGGL